MIVRDSPSLADSLFAFRGSILPSIAGKVVSMLLVSIAAVLLTRWHPSWLTGVSAMPFTLIGLSISIFMSFRNSASYDRWWEGRKLWGQFVISARSFARQTALIDPAERRPLLLGLCAVAAGLAARLRDEDEVGAIAARIGDAAAPGSPNPTDAALAAVGRACTMLMAERRIDPIHYSVLEAQLTEIGHVQGGCERIKATPLPFAYSLLLHRTVYLFCLLLPFALAPALEWWALPLVIIISYAFFGLDALSDELADPFGLDANDLPLDALVRSIERDLLAALGDEQLPPPFQPERYRLR
ncbi:bestrophin family protein [Sphingomonas abietis]|uniref:Bestrophin family protein n=1 Tax=Sphingomonas abietis TaxID=3012344 RepID=A0ABY7NSH5_9SPHN|nr:bestrophin family protein [Sphingomonas abietis]WBO23401.1 bestrophin family protein [Sphingomonas abietis]